jgi:hypothetical protein
MTMQRVLGRKWIGESGKGKRRPPAWDDMIKIDYRTLY